MTRSFIFRLIFIVSICAYASLVNAEVGAPNVVSTFSIAYLGKLILALVAVLAFFLLFAWIMKHQQRSGVAHTADLSIVGSLSLGTREKLIVVQIGSQQLVIGATQHQITKLAELSTPLEPKKKPQNPSFASSLQQILAKETDIS